MAVQLPPEAMLSRLAASPARALLRQATEAAHLRLHAEPNFVALAEGRMDVGGLRRLFARLFGFHGSMEARLLASGHAGLWGIELAAHGRTGLLRADLHALGVPDAVLDALPHCPAPADIGTPGGFLGCLYVLDGSRLGGAVLARALDPLFPGGRDAGRSYFAGGGRPAGPLWRETCDAVERCGADPAGLRQMTEGARATFAALETWLRPMRGEDAVCAAGE